MREAYPPGGRIRRDGPRDMIFKDNRRNRYTPIGIDVRDAEVHAVQFRIRPGGYDLHAVASERAGGREENGVGNVLDGLIQMMQSGYFMDNKAVCCMRNREVDIRPIVMPLGLYDETVEGFSEALILEARSALPYPPESAMIDFLPLGTEMVEGVENPALLLVASKKESVNRHLALMATAKINCAHLEGAPCALARVLSDTEGTLCVFDIDSACTEISIIEDGNLRFSRTLHTGYGHMAEQIEKALHVESDEAEFLLRDYGGTSGESVLCDYKEVAESGVLDKEVLLSTIFEICSATYQAFAKELKRSITYYSRHRGHGQVESAMLLGSCVPSMMAEFLSDWLSIPVEHLDIFDRLGIGAIKDVCNQGSFAIASGLALRDEL